MPAVPPYIIEPIFQQFRALLPERKMSHPLGCHRPRIPDRVVFEKLVQVLVFGCAYEKIADGSCSATTLRERRDEWIELGVIERLREMALGAYDRAIGLDLSELAVDCCITKAPCGGEKAGRSPVDRGKRDLKRSVVVDGRGIPLGSVTAPANRHDSPLCWFPPSTPLGRWGWHRRARPFTWTAATIRSPPGCACSGPRSPRADLPEGQVRAPERDQALGHRAHQLLWQAKLAHKKLLWCTERRGRVVDFWMALSAVVVVVRRLVREGWTRYRWDGRPSRRP